MKKIAFYFIIIAAVLITACQDDRSFDEYEYKVNAPVSAVTLDKATLELARNESATLKASITPDRATIKEVTWSTNNGNVATVTEDGEVFAAGLGNATITVTTVDGGKTATCQVIVTEMGPTRVRLNKTALALKVGEGETLTATITPGNASDKQLTWSTSDETVASVNQFGDVRALAPGEATITVTTVSGGQTHSCVVTVIQPVTGVELDIEEEDIPVIIGESHTFKAIVLPANASNKKVTWRISGTGITITDYDTPGQITIKRTGDGEAVITVVTVDGDFKASCNVVEKPFFPNVLTPFEATLADNFEWGEGYSGQVISGTKLFPPGDIAVGSTFKFEMEFTSNRDFEDDEIYAALVDTRDVASWWTVKGEETVDAGTVKAGEKVSLSITIVTTEATSSTTCNLHFETWGEGTQGTAGSGVKGPIKLSFSKFICNKLK